MTINCHAQHSNVLHLQAYLEGRPVVYRNVNSRVLITRTMFRTRMLYTVSYYNNTKSLFLSPFPDDYQVYLRQVYCTYEIYKSRDKQSVCFAPQELTFVATALLMSGAGDN